MGVGPRFEATPSWRLSILMVVIVCVSYSVEKFFHWVDHKLAGHDEYERSSNLIGAGGLFKFTFAAKNPGTTKLTFFYGRPWEHNTVVDETSAVDVPVLVV